ncbi:galactose mutarotase [Ricinus communis]|jgi:aldose 1-epimerase|uniref:galactose mutarotase n=1 Tax=Ricinus communis TaxID=3988 RepID=UPI00201A3C45|nr:galactose mutarotase [Ricinus communis]
MGKISFLFCFCILVAFGFANGAEEKVEFYELKKGNISMKLTNWGASIVSFVIPDKTGKPIDVVLGYDTIKEYQTDSTYFGAVVGRVANRIGGAEFKLNGKTYKLPANDGKNMLHGGAKGYSDVVWKVTKYKNSGNAPFIVFTHRSSDGEEGFPGALRVVVTYTLLADGQLSVFMKAKGLDDKVSPVSLAQHTYWNLAGHNSGNILEAKVRIFGQFYTAVDENLVPTGQLLYARGTAYDFTEPELKPVGKRIDLLPKGYDINYVLDDFEPNKIRQVAIVEDVKSGVRMELATDAPGLQFYTGNMINNVKGKGGVVYQAHAGLCLETQWYPDFVNHPAFPQSLVQQGKVYKHHMLFNFTTI